MAEKDRFRTKDIRVKLTAEEVEILNQNCFELDMSKSEFIRQIIIYGRLTEHVKAVDDSTLDAIRNLTFEVNRIGNNINQIAYGVNVKNHASLHDLENAKRMLMDATLKILDVLKEVS